MGVFGQVQSSEEDQVVSSLSLRRQVMSDQMMQIQMDNNNFDGQKVGRRGTLTRNAKGADSL